MMRREALSSPTDQTGKQLILLDGKDAITIMAKKSVVITNEDKSVIVMDEKSIGMQAETISIEGKKNITLVSGNESMVFSSEKNIINGSATNIKLEAAKEYDLNTQTGTMKGTNLTVEGTANMTVTGGIVKINS